MTRRIGAFGVSVDAADKADSKDIICTEKYLFTEEKPYPDSKHGKIAHVWKVAETLITFEI